MLKILISMICVSSAMASTEICQIKPGTNTCDYTKPTLVTEGDTTYQVKPGRTDRDYTSPSWETKNGETYEIKPGTNIRDWSKPYWKVDKKK